MLGAAAAAIQGQVGAASTYAGRVIGYSPDWYLPLGGSAATALIGAGGIYVHDLQLGVDSIAQDDPGGRSLGLSGLTTNAPHVTVSSPLVGPDLTIDLIFQPDSLTAKHVLITTLGGSVNGEFSVEVDAGGRPRAWSVEGGVAQVITGALEDVPQGEAVKITYQRQSNVPGWSQRFYVNGEMKAQDESQRTWAPVPAGTVFIGTWWDGEQFLAPTDGLIAHVAGWNRLLALVHIQDLVRTQSVAWAENIDAGSITSNASKIISVKEGGWHGKEPLVASAGDGALGTTTESGPDITYMAGSPTDSNDTFTYFFDDASGHTTPTRSVTIDVVASQSEGLPTSIAEIESRSGRTVTKTVDVAGGAAFTSLQAALNAAVAGDVIAVRGGKYHEFGITFSGIQGTSTNPIQIWGWHPDGVTAPELTAEHTGAVTWSGGPERWTASIGGASYAHGYLPENEGGWQLVAHRSLSTFDQSGDLQIGPAMFASGGTVFLRTTRGNRQTARLVPDGKLPAALPVQQNPNNWSGFRFSIFGNATSEQWSWIFSNCAHLHIRWINFFAGSHGVLLSNGTNNFSIRNVLSFRAGNICIKTELGGFAGGDRNLLFDRITFNQMLPLWIAWQDVKGDIQGGNEQLSHLIGQTLWIRNTWGIEISNCTIKYPWDMILMSADTGGMWFHHNAIIGCHDDTIQYGTNSVQCEVNHNVFLAFSGPAHNEGSGQPSADGAEFYIHHNVIDVASAKKLGLIRQQTSPFAYDSERCLGAHSTPNAPFPRRCWNNTFIMSSSVVSEGSNIGYLYGDSSARNIADRPHEVWNSIILADANESLLGVSGFGDVVDRHPSVGGTAPAELMDGMMFAKASGAAPLFKALKKLTGGTVTRDYANLVSYKNQVGAAHFSASETTTWYPVPPHRWNGNSVEEDPQLNGGTLLSAVPYTLDSLGRFVVPANWLRYRAHNTKAKNLGVNIAGRWNTAAPNGPRDRSGIEAGRTRFYIGAIDPVDDPTGSAIGPQA